MEGKAKGVHHRVYPPSDLRVFTPTQFTCYAALFNIGAFAGAFAGSALMHRVGRKRALTASALPHAAAWLGTAFVSDPAPLTMLRMLTGFAVGMGAAVTPVYIGEVSPPSLRGPLGAANQLSLTLGMFVVNLAGSYGTVVEFQGQSFCNWRGLAFVGMALAAGLATMVCFPESPRWLAQHGRSDEAKAALRKLRVGETAAEEAELDAARTESSASSSSSGPRPYRLCECKRSLVIATGLFFFLQFSGINAVMMYATDICAQAGMENAELSVALILMAKLALGLASCALVESFGRRRLLQVSGLTMCLAHLGLAYHYASQSAPPALALASLSLFVSGFSVGVGPVPWVILGEIFPVEVAGSASAIVTAVGWTCSFVVCMGFRYLQSEVGIAHAFVLFAAICFACLVFVTALVPETKGRSREEILSLMHCEATRARRVP